MKKSAVLVVAVLVLALVTMASAAQDNWRVAIKTDNGAGMAPNTGIQLGVYPTSLDGLDPQDGSPYGGIGADTPGTATHIAAVVDGQTDLYGKSIKAPTLPPGGKKWEFYVAGNVNYAYQQIRLRLFTVSTTSLPTATFSGWPVAYGVKMLDNRGMPGAPANGTIWQFPTPTAHSTTVPVWETTLPSIVLSAKSTLALRTEGYRLELIQGLPEDLFTPEPSSILALGSGLLGLAGYALRRRKA